MTFNLPKKYQVPEGIKDGETFKDLATFSVSKGKLTLISIGEDEVPISGKGDKPKGAKKAILDDLQNANESSAASDAEADTEN